MREMVVDLRRAQRFKTSEARIPAVAPKPRRPRWVIPAVSGVLVMLALAIVAWLLDRSDFFWRNPLANAQFTRLTDFEGTACDADISADGKFVVFLSDRDGPFDAWVHRLGTGEFVNLTKGRVPELWGEDHRNIGFFGDGAQVWLRIVGRTGGRITKTHIWMVPTMGGVPRPFLENAVNVAWSPDRNKIVYHGFGGDPIFIADRNGSNPKQIFVEKPGVHCHFPTWSPDGRYIYFVKGIPPAGEWDIWRIPSGGGQPG